MRFVEALHSADVPMIMEVKRQTGEGVDLLGSRNIDEIVSSYVAAGAPCISVVTGSWFGGSPDMMRQIAACTDLPLLRKDFITRRSQITESKRLGASAVLLTIDILRAPLGPGLIETCLEADVTPFVEIQSIDDLEQVVWPSECVVAVNNKDIRNRERGQPDFERSSRLLPELRARAVAAAVSASGVSEPSSAASLLDHGFDALLVGTGLMRAQCPARFVQELRERRSDAAVGVRK